MQFSDGAAGNLLYGSAPPGMHSSNSAVTGIDDQDRDAVCGFDRHQNARRVFNEGVAFSQRAAPAFGGDHRIGMDLVQSGDIWTLAEIIRQSGTKAVHQPIECVQRTDAIDIF